jgi:cycloeucalenol cycloisomerase
VSFFGWIVLSRVFEHFTPTIYMGLGVLIAAPPIVWPLLFPVHETDRALPWTERFTTKANLWIFCFAWIGNYFWTHYFYRILGAVYTFQAHRLNDVRTALHRG